MNFCTHKLSSVTPYLYQFENPRGVVDQVRPFHLVLDRLLQVRVAADVEVHARKEVADEREEERFVLVDEFRQVHVAQDAHHDGRLRVVGTCALRRAERAKDRQDVAQSEVIVHLWKSARILN